MTASHASLRLLGLVGGLLLWSSAFVALYALHAVGCALTWTEVGVGPVSLSQIVLLAVWLVHLALLILLLMRCRTWLRDTAPGTGDRFVARSSIALTVIAIVATAYTGLPVVLLRHCV
jgi:hypothetical protein